MKKTLAIILCMAFVLQLAACGTPVKPETTLPDAAKAAQQQLSDGQSATRETTPDATESIVTRPENLTDIQNFEDFKDMMDDHFDVIETTDEEGNTVIEIKPSEDKDHPPVVSDPVVPGIDTIIRPTEPEVTEPAPTEPAPTEPAPTEPAPTEPAPTEPAPTEPAPTEPAPTEPAPTEPPKMEYTYTTGQSHKAVHYTQRYLYSVLNEEQKIWYQKIDTAVKNLEDRVALGTDMMENDNYNIYYLYMMDNPEHFYLINKIGAYSSAGEEGLILGYSDGTYYCGMGYGNATDALRSGIRSKQAVFNRELQRIISTIPADAPAVVKEKLIYDRILIDSSYNLNAKWNGLAEDNWTAYGILVNKKGVCESYSEAFQLLCLYVGINCTGVVGTAMGGGHKWNAVQLDGEWYACDITFDDPIGGGQNAANFHDYFNLTSARMKELYHDVSTYLYPTPTCNGTKYSYQNYFGN